MGISLALVTKEFDAETRHVQHMIESEVGAAGHAAGGTPGHLPPEEAELYRDLVEQTFGPAVRLEQERVSYSAIAAAVSPHRPG